MIQTFHARIFPELRRISWGSPLVAWSHQGKSCERLEFCVVFLRTGKVGSLTVYDSWMTYDDVGRNDMKTTIKPLTSELLGRLHEFETFTFSRQCLRCQFYNIWDVNECNPPKKDIEKYKFQLLFIVVCVFVMFQKAMALQLWKHCGPFFKKKPYLFPPGQRVWEARTRPTIGWKDDQTAEVHPK